jgi:hypothetical protein
MIDSDATEPHRSDNVNSSHDDPGRFRSREVSGKPLVIGLFSLGIIATIILFVYWDRHTKPFRPLREAIGRKFRHSRPNVEGGRPKGRGPWTLRISMTVEFSPVEETEKGQEVFDQVMELVRQYQDISKIDEVDVVLIQFVPEDLAKTRKIVWQSKSEK